MERLSSRVTAVPAGHAVPRDTLAVAPMHCPVLLEGAEASARNHERAVK